jgi:hypothetical protein
MTSLPQLRVIEIPTAEAQIKDTFNGSQISMANYHRRSPHGSVMRLTFTGTSTAFDPASPPGSLSTSLHSTDQQQLHLARLRQVYLTLKVPKISNLSYAALVTLIAFGTGARCLPLMAPTDLVTLALLSSLVFLFSKFDMVSATLPWIKKDAILPPSSMAALLFGYMRRPLA